MRYTTSPSAGGAFPSELPEAPLDVAVIGAGRVGCSIARALAARDHRIVAVSVGRKPQRVLDVLGPVPIADPEDAALAANAVVISIPDDAIERAAQHVARGLRERAVVVHTSGIHGTQVLAACGPNIAAVHPAQTIPEPTTDLAGVYFGITAPDHVRQWAQWFVGQLGGIPVEVPEDRRALYHAALSMASNFTVALAADAGDLLGDVHVLGPLLCQTVENVARLGPDAALTGPIVRGDAGTVRRHLAALGESAPHLVDVYVANASRTLDRAVRSGRLDAANAKAVHDVLTQVRVR